MSVRGRGGLAASQTRTVQSLLAEARSRPSGLTATAVTAAACPLKVRISWPEAVSQTRTVSSAEPVTTVAPSGP